MKIYQKSIKMRLFALVLAIVSIFTMFPAVSASAASDENVSLLAAGDYSTGSWGYAYVNKSVYSDTGLTSKIGTIYANEGFTILYAYTPYVWYVEYSTSSGAKRGYISSDSVGGNGYLAKVTANTTVYYGPSVYEYSQAGTVYSGEYICVICQTDEWVYIEYNTTSGRKRGYAQNHSITRLSNYVADPLYMFDDSITASEMYYSGSATVYAGPSTHYAQIGSISNENIIYVLTITDTNTFWKYIEYYITGTSIKKSGFVQ